MTVNYNLNEAAMRLIRRQAEEAAYHFRDRIEADRLDDEAFEFMCGGNDDLSRLSDRQDIGDDTRRYFSRCYGQQFDDQGVYVHTRARRAVRR